MFLTGVYIRMAWNVLLTHDLDLIKLLLMSDNARVNAKSQ